jgi:hypothetical protein
MHLFVLLITLFALMFASPSLAAEEPGTGKVPVRIPRVRPADKRVATALSEGLERSASFRALVDRLNQLDVIVYVEMQPLLRQRLSGAMTWVTATTTFRYVRVSLNPDLNGFMSIAALAHELQHVVEVGEAASIVDNRSLSDYYRIAGLDKRVSSDRWETEAAQRTGEIVRRELAVSYNTAADSIQQR